MDEGMTKRGDAQRWHFSHESLARFAYLLLAIYAIINWLEESESPMPRSGSSGFLLSVRQGAPKNIHLSCHLNTNYKKQEAR